LLRVGVVSLGCPYHGNIFVNNMNAELKHYTFEFLQPSREYGWAHVNPKDFDVLWFYGFHALPDILISKFKEENPQLKVGVTWVGSDLLEFATFVRMRPHCAQCIVKSVDVHVADGRNLVEELDRLGIKATYIPSIPPETWQLTPLPEKFSVAAYVPGFRADFYNYPLILSAADQMPDVEFHLFGGGPVKLDVDVFSHPNVYYHGWVEGEERRKWWENSSVLLYLPQHSSLGVIAIEFLQMGRWVIYNQEYPHVFQCLHVNELLSVLQNLKNVKEPNVEGSKYYLGEFSPQKQAEKVKQILDEL